MRSFIDKHYATIRKFRFLYGWAKDSYTRSQCSKRAEVWKAKGYRDAKLDVCGGRNPYRPDDYLNVDIVHFPQVDLVFDITKPFPFDDGVIAEIFSAATLEHLRRQHNVHVLKEFHRVLQQGGILHVSTPDIEAIARKILDGWNNDEMNQHLFGKFKSKETDIYDLHKWMFTADQMISLLQEVGFSSAEKISMDDQLHDPELNYMIRAVK